MLANLFLKITQFRKLGFMQLIHDLTALANKVYLNSSTDIPFEFNHRVIFDRDGFFPLSPFSGDQRSRRLNFLLCDFNPLNSSTMRRSVKQKVQFPKNRPLADSFI